MRTSRSRWTTDDLNRIAERYAAGETYAAIASSYGIQTCAIWQALNRNGLRPEPHYGTPMRTRDLRQRLTEACTRTARVREIAATLGLSRETVRKYMGQFRIPSPHRTELQTRKERWQSMLHEGATPDDLARDARIGVDYARRWSRKHGLSLEDA